MSLIIVVESTNHFFNCHVIKKYDSQLYFYKMVERKLFKESLFKTASNDSGTLGT